MAEQSIAYDNMRQSLSHAKAQIDIFQQFLFRYNFGEVAGFDKETLPAWCDRCSRSWQPLSNS